LIASSWGAFLGFLLAARSPHLVGKLIMVGSASFVEAGASAVETTRLSRLTEQDRKTAARLRQVLIEKGDMDQSFRQLVDLYTRADAYDPITLDTETLEFQFEVNQRVWAEARTLRASGELLALGQAVHCPVVAVHGDYDPHPASAVFEPLSSVLSHFRPVLLQRCGHLPWLERQARDQFFELLTTELDAT
jgi:pimeloyl-ACP methyl ester carboxylesterase